MNNEHKKNIVYKLHVKHFICACDHMDSKNCFTYAFEMHIYPIGSHIKFNLIF